MDKFTKIIATIGPSLEDKDILRNLVNLGVNVFRFNLKHNDLSWHKEHINIIQEIAEDLNIHLGTLIDLQGPEIRTIIPSQEINVNINDLVTLDKNPNTDEKSFTISRPELIQYLRKGQRLVADDGRMEFKVEKLDSSDRVVLKSLSQGVLKTRKTFNLPGVSYPIDVLTKNDLEALKMAAENKVDFVALSFVRDVNDIETLRKEMKKAGLSAKIIAKIETAMAIDNLDSIIGVSDGLMVARGDLAVELTPEQVPYYQKIIIEKCIRRGIPVITATQMLSSMVESPVASRADISDIANAVYDLTDAVMLSEETAVGKYVEKTVDIMAKTIKFTEKSQIFDTRNIYDYVLSDQEEMVSDAAYNLYLSLLRKNKDVGGFIVFTQAGRTARKISRYRPKVPIYAFVPEVHIGNSLTLLYGVVPFLQERIFQKNEQVSMEHIQSALLYLKEKKLIDKSKYYILLHGDIWMEEGKISTIKIVTP